MARDENASAERVAGSRDRAALAVVGECCRLCRSDGNDLHGPFLSMVMRAFGVDRAAIYEPVESAGEFFLVEGAGFRGSAPARLSLGAPPPEFETASAGADNSAAGETLRRAFGVARAVWRFDAEAGMALMVGATQAAGDSALDFSETDREAVDAALSGFAGVRQAKSLEAELQKTRDRYSLLAENTLDVIWVVDLDLDYVFISPSITRARGWETEDMTGRSVTDFMTPESAEKVREALAQALADEQSGQPVADRSRVLELEMVTSDGEHITGRVTPYFVRDATGGVVAMAGVTDDITRRRHAEVEARESEERYELLAESIEDVVFMFDLDLNLVYISPSITRTRGWTPEELEGGPVAQTMTPESAELARAAFAEEMEREKSGQWAPDRSRMLALELLTKSGESFPAEVKLRFIRDEEGRPLAVAGVTRNITLRRRAEVEARASRERYELLAANIEDVIFSLDLDLNFVYLSPSVTRISGYEVGELLGRSVLTALTPASTAAVQEAMAEELERELSGEWPADRSRTVEVELLTRDGEPVLAEVTLRFVRNEEGQAVALAGVARDIRARRQAEMELRESRETAWAMLDATHDLAALLDMDYRVIGCNQAMARRLGTTPKELTGTGIFDLLPPRIRRTRRECMDEAVRTGETVIFEDGRDGRHYANAFYPIKGGDGQVHHVVIFAQNITERLQAEQAQRLAALGQLSAGVAHEFNNILAGIMLTMERAQMRGDSEAYEGIADRVRLLARRGAKIAGNLSAFAQPGEAGRRPVSVDGMLDSALAVTSTEVLQAGVLLDRERDGDKAHVVANSAELAQVFVNLIINACHAMPDGGTLTIRTSRVSDHRGKDTVLVTLTDTGSGIAAEHLSHVFEPFFTTKGPMSEGAALGTGLGLSVSHGIITGHGGTIEVESEPGVGTTFQVRLPASEEPPAADVASSMADAAEAVDKGTRVLLAEDEPDIGAMIAEVLERQGHRVDHVATADEAAQLLGDGAYDLVITDLLMPGGGGEGVLAAARSQDQQPLLMVITGHIGDDVGRQLREQGVDVVLKKPFGVLELLRSVEEIMDETDGNA